MKLNELYESDIDVKINNIVNNIINNIISSIGELKGSNVPILYDAEYVLNNMKIHLRVQALTGIDQWSDLKDEEYLEYYNNEIIPEYFKDNDFYEIDFLVNSSGIVVQFQYNPFERNNIFNNLNIKDIKNKLLKIMYDGVDSYNKYLRSIIHDRMNADNF